MQPETTLEPAVQTSYLRSLGIVSFLNALPLRASLESRHDIRLRPAVPSGLIEHLMSGKCDAALLPVVDFVRNRQYLTPVSDACIASDGETLTVRVFSKVPAEKVSRLHVDGDSHTSIMLARVIWHELYGRKLDLIPWTDRGGEGDMEGVESVLLIGDKVIRRAQRGFGFEVDLGAAWKHLTGLPFVFAAWYARKDVNCDELRRELENARDWGVANARSLAERAAADHGWPVETAIQYLCHIMKYRMTDTMRSGMQAFFERLERHGLLA